MSREMIRRREENEIKVLVGLGDKGIEVPRPYLDETEVLTLLVAEPLPQRWLPLELFSPTEVTSLNHMDQGPVEEVVQLLVEGGLL